MVPERAYMYEREYSAMASIAGGKSYIHSTNARGRVHRHVIAQTLSRLLISDLAGWSEPHQSRKFRPTNDTSGPTERGKGPAFTKRRPMDHLVTGTGQLSVNDVALGSCFMHSYVRSRTSQSDGVSTTTLGHIFLR